MRHLFNAAVLFLSISVTANASVLDSLHLGKTTPEDAKRLFEVLQDSGKGIERTMSCRKSKDAQVLLSFYSGKLYKYSVMLKLGSAELKELGSVDDIVAQSNQSLGKPKQSMRDGKWLLWDLGSNYYIVDQSIKGHLHLCLTSKVREDRASKTWTKPTMTIKQQFDGPHYLKGFRPEWTKTVKLFRGDYQMEARHQGKGNFIVYMVEAAGKDLVVNEIGNSYEYKVLKVYEKEKVVQFLVKQAGGPWEINLRKIRP